MRIGERGDALVPLRLYALVNARVPVTRPRLEVRHGACIPPRSDSEPDVWPAQPRTGRCHAREAPTRAACQARRTTSRALAPLRRERVLGRAKKPTARGRSSSMADAANSNEAARHVCTLASSFATRSA